MEREKWKEKSEKRKVESGKRKVESEMRKIVGLWLVENGNEESNFNNESNRGTFFCGRHQSFDCIIQLSLFIFYFFKKLL